MANYVLVHGGWFGAWCWYKVVPLLQAAGHSVYTPALTGVGEQAALLTPEIGLDTHIQDVVSLIETKDLQQVILVGHSYSGMVITGAADRVPDRIAQLVYLDAVVPRDGQSLVDTAPFIGRFLRREANKNGDGWRVDAPDLYAWLDAKRTGLEPSETCFGPHCDDPRATSSGRPAA